MIRVFGPLSAQHISTLRSRTPMYFQVIGPGVLFISHSQNALENQGSGGTDQGFRIQAADGIVLIWWFGELWARGDTPNMTVAIEAN